LADQPWVKNFAVCHGLPGFALALGVALHRVQLADENFMPESCMIDAGRFKEAVGAIPRNAK
jgi:hypothetical protein